MLNSIAFMVAAAEEEEAPDASASRGMAILAHVRGRGVVKWTEGS